MRNQPDTEPNMPPQPFGHAALAQQLRVGCWLGRLGVRAAGLANQGAGRWRVQKKGLPKRGAPKSSARADVCVTGAPGHAPARPPPGIWSWRRGAGGLGSPWLCGNMLGGKVLRTARRVVASGAYTRTRANQAAGAGCGRLVTQICVGVRPHIITWLAERGRHTGGAAVERRWWWVHSLQ